MLIKHQKITIVNVRRPSERNINHELQWLGTSLGLFNLRDKDKSCFRLFLELLKSAKVKKPLSSDELAIKMSLSRGTVIHHMDKLMDAGLVIHEGNSYMLRVDNLKLLISELEKDIQRTLGDLKEVASDIDNWMGL
jgi:predicted transcriptional regulator|tara:strand:- start:527 stop:934 length:408 start_codon:yes stop_codon:yes gene_type:complete